jgi:hypothetical protein
VFFFFDQRVNRGMLGLQFFDLRLVHRCHSFREQCHQP